MDKQALHDTHWDSSLLDDTFEDEFEDLEDPDELLDPTALARDPRSDRHLELSTIRFDIPHISQRMRVDSFLAKHVKYATRNRVQRAIAEGRVKVNQHAVKNSYGLLPGDVLEITIMRPAPESMKAEPMDLDIVYEDEDLVIVNKAAGIAVHPTYKHWDGTLANGLLHHFREQLGDPEAKIKPGLIHRLDKFTSGLLVVGKNAEAKRQLSKQFEQRQTRKVYQALVWGVPKAPSGLLETNLGISRLSRMVIDVYPYMGKQGKPARTAWKTLKSFTHFALLDVELFTGRTHQIRSHLRHIGHPIIGDFIYGGLAEHHPQFADQAWLTDLLTLIPRQALHAAKLGFYHPRDRRWLEFEAPLPADMVDAMNLLQTLNG